MCGIALVVSGIPFDLSSLLLDSIHPPLDFVHPEISIDDLKAALRRRGPDSLGSAKVRIFVSETSSSCEGTRVKSIIEREEDVRAAYRKEGYGMSENGSCIVSLGRSLLTSAAELYLIGATLQLRGINPITQPLLDAAENILVYNGEIFGGIYVSRDSNDAETLLQCLGKCCSCVSSFHDKKCYVNGKRQSTVPEVLSMIKGPWSVIYWQDNTKTLWFGRDAFGRRSLLVHWPTLEDSRFLLSSVSPALSVVQDSNFEAETGSGEFSFWEELPCGIYSLSFETQNPICCLLGEIRKHEWTNVELKAMIKWERINVVPGHGDVSSAENEISLGPCNVNSVSSENLLSPKRLRQPPVSRWAETVLDALKESVMRRSSLHTVFQLQFFEKYGRLSTTGGVSSDSIMGNVGPVAVLFSGGLDSMILAALLDQCLDCSFDIDLLNVSFDGPFAPDRITARDGIKQLQRISPLRRWKLVEIDADLESLMIETKHVTSLINPSNTYMDINIGIAQWLASGGDGWIYDESGYDDYANRRKYKSRARILLVGSGADEQCAGYGRHRTKYRLRSWVGLDEEMKLDMQRIWKRNLGRDDRCIADNGKEARFPFLDEDVIRTLLDIPLWEIADLDKPSGTGDKKILREVAKLLGLHEAAVLPKRAIQFGSRIARESNRKNFGSNRAANQASAGSVKIHERAKRTK